MAFLFLPFAVLVFFGLLCNLILPFGLFLCICHILKHGL